MKIKNLIMPFFLCSISFFISCAKKENKKLGDTYYQLALLELENQNLSDVDYKNALAHLEQALMHEEKSSYYALKATLLLLLKHDNESLLFFKKALEVAPHQKVKAEIENNYACLLAQSGNTKEALTLWDTLARSKDYVTPEVALVNQAKCYLSCGDYTNAHAKIHLAKMHSPQYVDAWYYAALIEWYTAYDRKEALASLHNVLLLEPTHPGALALRSVVLAEVES